jgi:precorrin-6Y C5,15-methyltransferase (decarboxylating)
VLYPGAKLLVLSADAQTPAMAARLLREGGFGESSITVLEHLGGTQERHIQGIANDWQFTESGGSKCHRHSAASPPIPHPGAAPPGLPNSAYHHDGQLTKREVRAITLSRLAPLPGQLLWDVGAGCGSIAIEWLQAIAVARGLRSNIIPPDYNTLPIMPPPWERPICKSSPESHRAALKDLPQPDAIFIGGGITTPHLLETCWLTLRPGVVLLPTLLQLKAN